jgi:hypothetical protein
LTLLFLSLQILLMLILLFPRFMQASPFRDLLLGDFIGRRSDLGNKVPYPSTFSSPLPSFSQVGPFPTPIRSYEMTSNEIKEDPHEGRDEVHDSCDYQKDTGDGAMEETEDEDKD